MQDKKNTLQRVSEIPAAKLAEIERNLRLLEETRAEVNQLKTKVEEANSQCTQFRLVGQEKVERALKHHPNF